MSLRAPLYSGHLFSTSEIWYQCELPPVSLREADLAGFLIERRDDTDCRRLLWCVCSGGSRCTSPLSSYSSRLLRRNQLWVCFVTCLDTVKGWNNHLLCSLSDQTGHVVHLDSCKWNKADMYTHTHTLFLVSLKGVRTDARQFTLSCPPRSKLSVCLSHPLRVL